jgi:hypothetical protein
MSRRLRREPETILNPDKPITEQQPKRVVYIEMFRAGPQISSTGQKMVFAEDDLDQVVNSYSPGRHEAPMIIGHEQDDSTPALGWVREVWRKGKALWGKVELTPKAEQLLRDGVFKKVSSSFYLPDADTNPTPGNLSLRHLGLVSIPAVKGLTAFSETIPEGSITITPRESSISFQETFPTMAKRKTEAPQQQVVDHADGKGMTINVNINGMKTGTEPDQVDDSGFEPETTGPAAPYDMEYADGQAPMPGEADPSLQRLEMVEGPDGEEMGDEDGGEGAPMPADGEGPGGEEAPEAEAPEAEAPDVEDVSEDDDEKIASELAGQYTEEQLIMALYQLAQSGASSEMGEGADMMGYSESESDDKVESFSEPVVDPLAEKVAQLEEELAAQRRLMRQKEITDFCEGLYEDGKLTEQVVPITDLSRFMETLNAKNNVNFSESKKASQFDFMKSVLEKLPAMVTFSEVAAPATAPKRPKAARPNADGYVYDERNAEIHAKAVEYAEAHGTDYMSALKLVIED